MKRNLTCLIALLFVLATQVRAEDRPSVGAVPAMTAAAQGFVATLDEKTRPQATMDFDNPKRLDWHNIPKPERKGLAIKQMSAEQLKTCHALLRSVLSDAGYEKACRIMSLENNLREGEKGQKGTPLRDPGRYFLTIFGKPEATGSWGWSVEGHHLSINVAIRDGKIIGDTPSFFGANPATVSLFIEGGPEKGIRTLAKEELLAFDLLASLSDAERAKAIIAAKAPEDYRNAGKPQPPAGPAEGLAAGSMNKDQQKLLWSILENYSGNMTKEVTEARLAEIKAAGPDKVHFAWAGATKPGVGHYFRVQGPTFVLELINVQSDPAGNVANHIHSVWRSLTHDFGVTSK